MARARHRRWISVAVVPLIVILGLESAWAAYACGMDGQVRDRCCCPAAEHDEGVDDDGPTFASRCCCDVTIHAQGDAPSAQEVSRLEHTHLVLALPPTTFVAAATVHAKRIVSAHAFARPPPRVALYLDKHALLR